MSIIKGVCKTCGQTWEVDCLNHSKEIVTRQLNKMASYVCIPGDHYVLAGNLMNDYNWDLSELKEYAVAKKPQFIGEGNLRPVSCYEGPFEFDLTVEIKGMDKDHASRTYFGLNYNEVRNMINAPADEFKKAHKEDKGGSHEDTFAKYSWKRVDEGKTGPMEKLATEEKAPCLLCGGTGQDPIRKTPCPECTTDQPEKTAAQCPHGYDDALTCGKCVEEAKNQAEEVGHQHDESTHYAELGKKADWEAKCNKCGKQFPASKAQRKYYKEYEGATSQYEEVCPFCGESSRNWEDLGNIDLDTPPDSPSLEDSGNELGTYTSSLSKQAEPPKPTDPPPAPVTPPEYKELKIRPKDISPEEVESAIEPSDALKKAYTKIKNSQNKLAELRNLVASLRAEFEKQKSIVEEKGGRLKEESAFKQGIDEIAMLISQAEKRVVNFGDHIVAFVEEVVKKDVRPDDKWKLEKLLAKYGEDAEKYLESAVRGLQAQAKAETVRKVIEFELKQHSAKPQARPPESAKPKAKLGKLDIEKKADALDTLRDIFNNIKHFVFETTRSMAGLDAISGDLGLGEVEPKVK